eukprot:gene4333-4908_t
MDNSTEASQCGKSWLRIGNIILTAEDRDILDSKDMWLNDKLINAAEILLMKQFPHIGGFQDTLLQASPEVFVKFEDVEKQDDASSCGLFAIAFATMMYCNLCSVSYHKSCVNVHKVTTKNIPGENKWISEECSNQCKAAAQLKSPDLFAMGGISCPPSALSEALNSENTSTSSQEVQTNSNASIEDEVSSIFERPTRMMMNRSIAAIGISSATTSSVHSHSTSLPRQGGIGIAGPIGRHMFHLPISARPNDKVFPKQQPKVELMERGHVFQAITGNLKDGETDDTCDYEEQELMPPKCKKMHINMLSQADSLGDELPLAINELPPAFLRMNTNHAALSTQPNSDIQKQFADLRSYLDHNKTPLIDIALSSTNRIVVRRRKL